MNQATQQTKEAAKGISAKPSNKPGNKKTALALASMALVFFAGVIIKRWLFPGP